MDEVVQARVGVVTVTVELQLPAAGREADVVVLVVAQVAQEGGDVSVLTSPTDQIDIGVVPLAERRLAAMFANGQAPSMRKTTPRAAPASTMRRASSRIRRRVLRASGVG
jgi:hypothetical protein